MKEADKDKCYRWRQIQALSAICYTISNNRPDGIFPVETLCIVKEIRPNEIRYKYTGYGAIVQDFEAGRVLADNVDKRWFYKAKIPDLMGHNDAQTETIKCEKNEKPKKRRGRKPKNKPDNITECNNDNTLIPQLSEETKFDAEEKKSESINDDSFTETSNKISTELSMDKKTIENHIAVSESWNMLTDQDTWPMANEVNEEQNLGDGGDESDRTVDLVDEDKIPNYAEEMSVTDPLDSVNYEDDLEVKSESESANVNVKPKAAIVRTGRGRPRMKVTLPVKKRGIKTRSRAIKKEKIEYSDEDPLDSSESDEEVMNKKKRANNVNKRFRKKIKKESGDDNDFNHDQEISDGNKVKRRRRRLKPSEHPSEHCPVCRKLIPVVNLPTHLHMHEVKRKRNANMKYCNNCHKFVEGSIYAAHKARHVEENSVGLRCEKCDETVRRVRYRYHFMRCVGKPPYFCFPCGKSYDRADRYILHHKSLHGWDPCEAFDRMFRESPAGKKFLEERVKAAARKAVETLSTDEPHIDLDVAKTEDIDAELVYPQAPKQRDFLCNKCGEKRNSRAALQEHMVSHIESRDYHCQICDKTFKTLKALNVHVKYTLMHGNTPKRMCKYCGKCFVLQSQLATHEKRMHEEANAKMPLPRTACTVCGKMVLKRNIAVHLKTHSEERPYSCAVCGMRFKFTDILKRHMILHTGTRNFHCEICGKSFAQSATLYKHRLTHREKQPKQEKQQPNISHSLHPGPPHQVVSTQPPRQPQPQPQPQVIQPQVHEQQPQMEQPQPHQIMAAHQHAAIQLPLNMATNEMNHSTIPCTTATLQHSLPCLPPPQGLQLNYPPNVPSSTPHTMTSNIPPSMW